MARMISANRRRRRKATAPAADKAMVRWSALLFVACNLFFSTLKPGNKRGIVSVALAANRYGWNINQEYMQQMQQQQREFLTVQRNDPNNYYDALDIDRGAEAKDIKSAYRRLALKYHPDKFREDASLSDNENKELRDENEEQLIRVSEAYEVLSDEKKREAYNILGQYGLDMLEKGYDPAPWASQIEHYATNGL